MSGKGSGRRPQQVPDDEARANWERIFGQKPETENNGEQPTDKESHDGGC